MPNSTISKPSITEDINPQSSRRISGDSLKVGDTIEVWWKPNRDTITKIEPYDGPMRKYGITGILRFALNPTGMSFCDDDDFTLISRSGEALLCKTGGVR